MLLFFFLPKNHIDQIARYNPYQHLSKQKPENHGSAARISQQNQHRFIRSGKENSQQSSQSNDASGIQVGRRHGKTTLGNAAEKGSHYRPRLSHFSEYTVHIVIRIMLQRFQCQKGRQQKGYHSNRIQKRMFQRMQYHNFISLSVLTG